MAVIHLALDLPAHFEFDTFVRYMDALRNPEVPSYVMLDARIGWRPSRDVEISVTGQNLTDPGHPEVGGPAAAEIARSVFGKLTWRF